MKVAAVIAACALGACGFEMKLGGTELDAGTGSDAVTIDGPAIDMQLVDPVDCATADATGLLLCFELEDGVADGTLRDSSPAHVDATTTGLEPAQRTKPSTSQAATVLTTVATYVPDSPSLDLASAYTVTMWVRPDSVPPASRTLGLFDHELQYAGAIAKAGGSTAHLRCVNTGFPYVATSRIPTSTWSFIACTWDGVRLCASYWSTTADFERTCEEPGGISTGGVQGLAMGHLSSGGTPEQPLDGGFDSVQVYSRALDTEDLCGIVGIDDCFEERD